MHEAIPSLQTSPSVDSALTLHPAQQLGQRVPCSEQTEDSTSTQPVSVVLAAGLWSWLCCSYIFFKEGGRLTDVLRSRSITPAFVIMVDDQQTSQTGSRNLTACRMKESSFLALT